MFTQQEIKSGLSRLWKDTFHDSDAYVSLIFDNYFDPELCEFEESEGQIVAGMVGIPYQFGNDSRSLSGLYLCGLATNPKYRSRGIMTRLLVRINEKARQKGFAFTFLIPADSGLRKYYADRGYVNAFYRVIDNYTSLHDFDRDYESVLAEIKDKVAELKRQYYNSLGTGVLNASNMALEERIRGVKQLIGSLQKDQDDFQLLHSDRDIELVLEENRLSGGEVHYACTSDGEVTAAAFVTFEEGVSNVVKIYASDMASKYKVLGSVKHRYPELPIRHYLPSIEMDRSALWMRTYGTVMKSSNQVPEISMTERVYSLAAHAKVYGMARVLDLCEILKFQAEGRRDLKYSILVKGENPDETVCIEVRDGKLKERVLEGVDSEKASHVMTRRDAAAILFRRRDTDNLITEAFGIPSINAAASLLLD